MNKAVLMLALTCACATFSNMAGAAGDAPVIKQNVRLLSEPPASYPEAAKAAGSGPKILDTSRKFSKAFDKTVARCAEKPDEKYWENIKSGMSAWF